VTRGLNKNIRTSRTAATYLAIILTLLFLTGTTIWPGLREFSGRFNIVVALAIATP